MISPKSNIALIVHACDRYEFLFKGFEYFFNKNFDPQIVSTNYFATEEKQVHIPNFQNIHSGKGEWSDRLRFLLINHIKEDYVLYFQEDMWLTKPVNAKFFNQLFEISIRNQYPLVKLHSSEVYQTQNTEITIEGFNLALLDPKMSKYLMSHQVSLWNKKFLIDQLHKNENPWRNEKRGTKRLKKINPTIYHVDYFAENGKPEINQNLNPILRSEYKTISLNAMLTDDVLPFIKELKTQDSTFQAYAQNLENHYLNKITHDGKSQPRRLDIFQKIKKWLKK